MTDLYDIEKYNLYEILEEELKIKASDWTLKNKVDYIYYRLCQIFSYDERYFYFDNLKMKKDIFDRKVDMSNVDTRKLVCTSFSYLFTDIVNKLFDNDETFNKCEVLDSGKSHKFSCVDFGEYRCFYDPIEGGNDFLRAKKGMYVDGICIENADFDDINSKQFL